MVKRGVEFGLGLAGTIMSGLLAIVSIIAGIILGASLTGAGWEHYDYSSFQYGINSMQGAFLAVLMFLVIFISVLLFIIGLLSIASFVLGLMGIVGLKKRANEPARREGILLIVGGALGNVLMLTAGILALSKNPDRIVHNKPNSRKLEFALGLVGSIVMGVGLLTNLVNRFIYLGQNTYNSFSSYGYSYAYSMMYEAISVFVIILVIIGGGAAIALSIIGTVKIKNKKGTDNTKTEGVLLLIGGILGLNAFSLSAGILALTKRGK